MNKKKLLIRIIAYLAFVLCLFLILKSSGFTVEDLNPDTIKSLGHDNLWLMLLIMFVIMVLQNLFTFIPLVLVIATNITLFDFWYGYLYGSLCSVVGSTIIFLSIRYLFKNAFSNSILQRYDEKIEKNGFLFVLSARILPFLPTNLINIASGLSKMKTWHFIAATTIGNMIYGLALATVSFSVITVIGHHPVYLMIGVVIIIAGVLLFRNYKKRNEQMNQ